MSTALGGIPITLVPAAAPPPGVAVRPPGTPGDRSRARGRGRLSHRWVTACVVVGAVSLRLPLLGRPPTPDEAGFLVVGGQWRTGGTSLYGDYWVDRPPLLIGLYRLAAQTGGLVPLRLLGCLATVLVVLGVAHLAGRLAGPRAAGWAGVAAGAWLVSPLTGALAVNGELVSAPFVVWGITAVVAALRTRDRRIGWLAGTAAGAALVGALLVDDVLAGPEAPTWFVAWGGTATWGVDDRTLGSRLAARYHPVADLAGRTVYLRDGVHRPTPELAVGTGLTVLRDAG